MRKVGTIRLLLHLAEDARPYDGLTCRDRRSATNARTFPRVTAAGPLQVIEIVVTDHTQTIARVPPWLIQEPIFDVREVRQAHAVGRTCHPCRWLPRVIVFFCETCGVLKGQGIAFHS